MLRIRGTCGAAPDEGIGFNALDMLINAASALDVALGDRA